MKAQLDKIIEAGISSGVAAGAVAIVVNKDGVLWEGAAGAYLSQILPFADER